MAKRMKSSLDTLTLQCASCDGEDEGEAEEDEEGEELMVVTVRRMQMCIK